MIFSISCFVNGENDLNRLKKIADKGINCQLAFFHYDNFVNYRSYIPLDLKISSLHGFNAGKEDTINSYVKKLEELKDYFYDRKIDKTTDFMVTVHPNNFGAEFSSYNWLYPENFRYKKRKKLLTPLHILKTCSRITLDTSHLENEWFQSEDLLKFLLMNTDILHFSQRESDSYESEHRPIYSKGLVPSGFILKTLKYFPVKEIVLEYMPEYIDRAIKDYYSLYNIFEIK